MYLTRLQLADTTILSTAAGAHSSIDLPAKVAGEGAFQKLLGSFQKAASSAERALQPMLFLRVPKLFTLCPGDQPGAQHASLGSSASFETLA